MEFTYFFPLRNFFFRRSHHISSISFSPSLLPSLLPTFFSTFVPVFSTSRIVCLDLYSSSSLIRYGCKPSICHCHRRHLLRAPALQWPPLGCPPLPVSLSSDLKVPDLPLCSSSTPVPRPVESSRCLGTADLHRREYMLLRVLGYNHLTSRTSSRDTRDDQFDPTVCSSSP